MLQSTKSLVIYTLVLILCAGLSLVVWNVKLPQNTADNLKESGSNPANFSCDNTQSNKKGEQQASNLVVISETNQSAVTVNVEVRLPDTADEDSEYYFLVVQVPKSSLPYRFKIIAEQDTGNIPSASNSANTLNQQKMELYPLVSSPAEQNKKRSPFKKQTPQPTVSISQSTNKFINQVFTQSTGFVGNISRTKIALALPVSSGHKQITKFASMDDSPLWSILFPSFLNCTIFNETQEHFEYKVFIGYDQGDAVFDQPGAGQQLVENFFLMMQLRWPDHNISSFPITLELCRINNMQSAPSWIVSELLNKAYQEGFHYFFQINDDTEFLDPFWENALVERLVKNPFLTNFGVTGPEDMYNRRVVTHAFVHRTHMEIFGRMFDEYFKNWWSDDWISSVYGKANLLRDPGVTVRHHAGMPRYQIHMEARQEIDKRVSAGKDKIFQWLSTNHPEKAQPWLTSWKVAIGPFPGFIGEKEATKKPL